MVQGALGNW